MAELSEKQLDRHYKQQIEKYELVFTHKACQSDQKIIISWMRILNAATKTQKLARNCLMLLMYGHITEIGFLQEPFTDMRNISKDLNEILDSYVGLPVPKPKKFSAKDLTAYIAETRELLAKNDKPMAIIKKFDGNHTEMMEDVQDPLKDACNVDKDLKKPSNKQSKDVKEMDDPMTEFRKVEENFKDILGSYKDLPSLNKDKSSEDSSAVEKRRALEDVFKTMFGRSEELPPIPDTSSNKKIAATETSDFVEKPSQNPLTNIRNVEKNRNNNKLATFTALTKVVIKKKEKPLDLLQRCDKTDNISKAVNRNSIRKEVRKDLENQLSPKDSLSKLNATKMPSSPKPKEKSIESYSLTIDEAFETFDSHYVYKRTAAQPLHELIKIVDKIIEDKKAQESGATFNAVTKPKQDIKP